MRTHSVPLIILAIAMTATTTSFTAGLPQAVQPIPRGRTEANNATRQGEKVEPPVAVPHTVSADELQKQADELLALAQQVHTDTERATQGVLNKDLKDKLKRIEKLSKKLRDELQL